MFKNIYNNKIVLVTGNTGFKGSWLTTWLLNLGAKVIGLSDKIPTEPSMYEVLDLERRITHHTMDIRDVPEVVALIQKAKPDFVFHLAAQAIVSRSYNDPLETFQINVLGTANILDALRLSNHPCTAVLITSDKCYENVEWTWGYRENDRLGGKDPYSASKAGAEIVIYTYYHSFFNKKNSNVRIASARAGNVIGGGDWADSRIVPDCVRSWAKDEAVIIRRPHATRPWQHVLEPISGYLTLGQRLSESEHLSGESFNFGPSSDQTFTVQQMIEAIADNWTFKTGHEKIILQDDPGFHEAGLLKLNCDKALHYLKWKPVLSFKEAASFSARWYNQHYHTSGADLFGLTQSQIQTYSEAAKKINLEWSL
jgi:CDP-glucose 4,6-dehydratase